jgi:hypothetical protein
MSSNVSSKTATVDLLDMANQIATTAKSIHKLVEDTQRPQSIKAGKLVGKLPELKQLPSDLTLFRVRKKDAIFQCDTLCAYMSDDGEALIYTTELDTVSDFKFIRHKTGIGGYCEIKHSSGLEFRIAISCSDDARIDDSVEAEGKPLPTYLAKVPRPEIPLYSVILPQNEELEIVSNGLKSREYGSALVTVKVVKTGEILKNIICNAALDRVLNKHGIGAKFKIAGKTPITNKKGEPIDANGKVNKVKPMWNVQIVDCQGTDFSDLSL